MVTHDTAISQKKEVGQQLSHAGEARTAVIVAHMPSGCTSMHKKCPWLSPALFRSNMKSEHG